jgi:hypothetical protein
VKGSKLAGRTRNLLINIIKVVQGLEQRIKRFGSVKSKLFSGPKNESETSADRTGDLAEVTKTISYLLRRTANSETLPRTLLGILAASHGWLVCPLTLAFGATRLVFFEACS